MDTSDYEFKKVLKENDFKVNVTYVDGAFELDYLFYWLNDKFADYELINIKSDNINEIKFVIVDDVNLRNRKITYNIIGIGTIYNERLNTIYKFSEYDNVDRSNEIEDSIEFTIFDAYTKFHNYKSRLEVLEEEYNDTKKILNDYQNHFGYDF